MKKIILFFVIGVFLIVIGTSMIISYSNSINDKFPDLTLLISNEMLEPAQSVRSIITLEKGEKFFVTTTAQPITNTLYFSIINNDTSFSKEFLFNDLASFPIVANSTENFLIEIGNVGSEISIVNGFITKNPIIGDEELVFEYGSGLLNSTALIFIGFILILVGIIIFVIDKKRVKSKVTK